MANYGAADVKRLREETDAPMMECKAALDEADGDFTRAKDILREKGKAAAAKRTGRTTAAGVVAIAQSDDAKLLGAVVVECETDFVARNEEFIAIAQQIAELVRDGAGANDSKVAEIVEGAVAKIRENIKVTQAHRLNGGGTYVSYVHHDRTKGSAVEVEGPVTDAVRKVAIQAVAFPPEVLAKEDLSQDKINAEIETETQRALNEGKSEAIARNVATGRVNKEFLKRVVLLEQPLYLDPSKSVGQYLNEEGKGAKIKSFVYLAVGQAQ